MKIRQNVQGVLAWQLQQCVNDDQDVQISFLSLLRSPTMRLGVPRATHVS